MHFCFEERWAKSMTSLNKDEFLYSFFGPLSPLQTLSNSTNILETPSFCSCMKSFPKLWVVCLVFRGRFCKYLRRDMHKHPKRLTGDTDMWQWKALAFQCQCLSSENGLWEQATSYWWSRSQFDKAQRERPSFTTLGPIAGRGRGGTQQGARLGTEGQWKSRPSRPEGP